MNEITQILNAIEKGDRQAAEELLPLVYNELRQLAAKKMAQQAPGQTLQATALVHEAYLRLVGPEQSKEWNNRGHFFRAAAEAMRHILVDQARRKNSDKHGGDRQRVDLDKAPAQAPELSEDVLAIDEALELLAERDAAKAELVKLRYFGGLTVEEAAEILGISRATADRYWRYAKTWLYCQLTRDNKTDSE